MLVVRELPTVMGKKPKKALAFNFSLYKLFFSSDFPRKAKHKYPPEKQIKLSDKTKPDAFNFRIAIDHNGSRSKV